MTKRVTFSKQDKATTPLRGRGAKQTDGQKRGAGSCRARSFPPPPGRGRQPIFSTPSLEAAARAGTGATHEPDTASMEAVVGALARSRGPLSLLAAHGGTALFRGYARLAASASLPGPPELKRHADLRLIGGRSPEPYAAAPPRWRRSSSASAQDACHRGDYRAGDAGRHERQQTSGGVPFFEVIGISNQP